MVKKTGVSIFVMAAIAGAAARAQVQDGPTPEQQQMAQQMQDLRMKILDNMTKQGVDPMQFFQQMMTQVQDGTFDINDFNQQLIDKGLIDQDTLTKAQESMQKLTLDGIKRELGVTDEEWAILVPKIKDYVVAKSKLGAGNPASMGGPAGMGAFMTGQTGRNDITSALRELRAAVRDKTTPDTTITEKLKAVRDARKKGADDLAAAKKELTDIVTMRQEAILVRIGVLE